MHARTSTDSQLLTCAPAAFAAATAATTASLGPRSRTCAASGGTIALQPTEPAACSLTGGSVCMLLISMRTPLTLSWQMGKVRPKTRGLGSSCFTCEKKQKKPKQTSNVQEFGSDGVGHHLRPHALLCNAVYVYSLEAPWVGAWDRR